MSNPKAELEKGFFSHPIGHGGSPSPGVAGTVSSCTAIFENPWPRFSIPDVTPRPMAKFLLGGRFWGAARSSEIVDKGKRDVTLRQMEGKQEKMVSVPELCVAVRLRRCASLTPVFQSASCCQ